MKIIAFHVYGKPATAGSKVAFRHSKTGKTIVKDSCKRGPEWRTDVRAAAIVAMQAHGVELLKGAICLRVLFHLPRPVCHIGKGGELRKTAPKYPITKPDTTKMLRALEDALNGIVWSDDSQIVSQYAEKQYTTGRPGAIVEVMTA